MKVLLRSAAFFLQFCVIALFSVNGHGQGFPSKPIRIVTTDAGGSSDFFLRFMTQDLTAALGQAVVIDNRPGSGVIPGEIVSKAPADGYTLLFFTSNFWISPLLQKTSYDPVRDFSPISLTTRACSVLVVTPTLPAKSVKDVITLAKARPGELNYAHGSSGSASHLAGAMFKAMTGVNMVNIPYKGSAQALIDVMSGQTQLMFPNAAVVPPHIKAGKLRALAVSSAQRSVLFPGLPTVGETVPGFQSGTMNGLFSPARTPEAVIRRLNQEVVRFVNLPEIRDRLHAAGVEPVGSSPQEFATVITGEMAMWSKVIKSAGIRAD
jgi:tripartite-type tricarboxylate transporter receptor subunit TctC